MKFITFMFSFLFVRNWHTGQLELSHPRVALFLGMVGLVLLGLLLTVFLQTSIEYTR